MKRRNCGLFAINKTIVFALLASAWGNGNARSASAREHPSDQSATKRLAPFRPSRTAKPHRASRDTSFAGRDAASDEIFNASLKRGMSAMGRRRTFAWRVGS